MSSSDMGLSLTFLRGSVVIHPPEDDYETLPLQGTPDIRGLTKEISRHLQTLVVPTTVAKPKGARGFSFHWSNSQGAWDVVPWNDPSTHTDGATFLVYFVKGTLSPLGKPWSLKEMEYVAKMLPEHPGFSQSFESRRASASRVAARFHDGRLR